MTASVIPLSEYIRAARGMTEMERGIQDAIKEAFDVKGMAIKLAPLSLGREGAPEPKRGGGSVSPFPLRFVQLPCDVEGAA